MKPLFVLLWLALVSTALSAQSLNCSIELFRIEGPIKAGPPDLAGRQPYAVQNFTVTLWQAQSFRAVIDGTTIKSDVTVRPGKERDDFQTQLDLEMIERGKMPPHIETKVGAKTTLVVRLNQPTPVSHSSENGDLIKVWRVTLTP